MNSTTETRMRDPKFYGELKELNDELLRLVESTHKKSPYFDFTPTLNDYIKQFNELDKQYPPGSDVKEPSKIFAPILAAATTTASSSSTSSLSFSSTNTFITAPLAPTTAPTTTTTTTTTTATTSQPPVSTSTAPLFSFGTSASTLPSQPFSFTLPPINFNTSTALPTNTTFNFNTTTATTTNTTTNNDETNTNEETVNDDEGDDAPPPEPNTERYEEPDAKYQVRCKLYERCGVKSGGTAQVTILGCGVLYVKELESPNKLQVIVRQDPDLNRVLFNQAITQNIPLKLLPKAVQMIVLGPSGESKFYIAKVKDEKDAKELFELLNSTKMASQTT